MTIPESQLSRWSHHGPQDASIRTHQSIRRALDAYRWPTDVTYDFYLQGSYRNDTNISGDSDVDIVIELRSALQHEADLLTEYDRRRLEASFQSATYDWNDFRRDALKVLEAGFGKNFVAQGNKSIKVESGSS